MPLATALSAAAAEEQPILEEEEEEAVVVVAAAAVVLMAAAVARGNGAEKGTERGGGHSVGCRCVHSGRRRYATVTRNRRVTAT